MNDAVIQEINEALKGKIFLSLDDIVQVLNCPKEVVYNWTKRHDPAKRPPRVLFGREFRFPRQKFLLWLEKELNPES